MLGYASPSPVAVRRFSPTSIALILAGHAALLALVISARMDVVTKEIFPPLITIPLKKLPPPPPSPPSDPHRTTKPVDTQAPIRDLPIAAPPLPPIIDTLDPPIKIDTGPYSGGETIFEPPPKPHMIAHRPAVLATPEDRLRPPYPLSKQRLGEEASLSLRLTIGADGRVIAVDPVGRADPEFLAAARRHILAHWHYRPASDDGSAVASVIDITLSFRLDEAG